MENLQNNNLNLIQTLKNFFLQSSAKRLFILFIISPFLCIFIINIIILDNNPILTSVLVSLIFLSVVILYLGWLYILGISLYQKLPIGHNMNVHFFKFNLIYTVLCYLFIIIIINTEYKEILNNIFISFFYLYAGFCLLYVIYFVSKALTSAEKQRITRFYEYWGVLFMFWYLPLGIWTLQLRIRKIFNQ